MIYYLFKIDSTTGPNSCLSEAISFQNMRLSYLFCRYLIFMLMRSLSTIFSSSLSISYPRCSILLILLPEKQI